MALWADRLVSELDVSDERARKLLSGLSAEQLNWQPADGRWSVGQCLEHLCVANEIYLPAISRGLEGKPKKPVEKITPGWFGRWFIESFIEPSAKQKKVPAPKKIVPSSRVETSVLERFLAGNKATREVIGRAREYDVNRIRFRNPLISVIWFTVGTGLMIISGHERRHLLQAERVRAAEGFPG